ncbi:MAG: methyltransferase domain-containing protein [Planctomycetota bacterium]|nr:MAG: methyltransferase domain-containing protein [Planctomycetota bacterium]
MALAWAQRRAFRTSGRHSRRLAVVPAEDRSFDSVVSSFGAMFAPKPFVVAQEIVRVVWRGGRIIMGDWIPNDPTFRAAALRSEAAQGHHREADRLAPREQLRRSGPQGRAAGAG